MLVSHLPGLFSLQLHQEARAALTRASSSVQAATVTVTGARTLLADLEGTCALLSPRLNAQIPMSATWTRLSQDRLGCRRQKCSHVDISQVDHSLHQDRSRGCLSLPVSCTTHQVLGHVAIHHQTTCREPDAIGCLLLV